MLEENTDTDEILILKKMQHPIWVPFKNMVEMASFLGYRKLKQIEN